MMCREVMASGLTKRRLVKGLQDWRITSGRITSGRDEQLDEPTHPRADRRPSDQRLDDHFAQRQSHLMTRYEGHPPRAALSAL